jgi:hypothetical protein
MTRDDGDGDGDGDDAMSQGSGAAHGDGHFCMIVSHYCNHFDSAY